MNKQDNKCIKKLWKLWYQFNQYFMGYENKGNPWVGEDLTVQVQGDFKRQMEGVDKHTSLYTNMEHWRKKYSTNSTGDQWKEFLRGALLIYVVRIENQIMWSLYLSLLVFCPAICISISFSSLLLIFNNCVGNICIIIFIHNIFHPSWSNLSHIHLALNSNKHKNR